MASEVGAWMAAMWFWIIVGFDAANPPDEDLEKILLPPMKLIGNHYRAP